MIKISQTSLEKPGGGQVETANNQDQESECFDLIGIGFGPSNLSLSVRLAEENLTTTQPAPQFKSAVSERDDHNLAPVSSLKTCFIESNDCFRWHPGMMIDGSRMQISFLKDLVTLRNPCSPFSFLNYLHHHDRLIDFINCATFTPSRLEFADYLAWVARQVVKCSSPSATQIEIAASHIRNSIHLYYGERVISVKGVVATSGDVNFLRVSSITSSDDSVRHYLCRNLIISVGGSPRVPRCCEGLLYEPPAKSCYVIHTSTFLRQIDHILSDVVQLASASPKQDHQLHPISKPTFNRSQCSISLMSSVSSDERSCDAVPADLCSNDQAVSGNSTKIRIAVVGAGQSAAETFLETYNRLKSSLSRISGLENRAEIDLIIKSGHLKPSDDSPFVNQVFNPKSTDFFYKLNSKELPRSSKIQRPIHDQKNVKDFLLKESASTNYAVVNSETLTALHDIMYIQKVQESIHLQNRQLSDRDHLMDPKMNIINYTEMISTEPNSNLDGSVNVVLRNILNGTQTSSHYHVVILGTGYFRQSWKQVLFGRPTEFPDSGVHLADLWPSLSVELQGQRDASADPAMEDSPTNSILSSRSSDEQDHISCCSSESSQKSLNDIQVARNYRLLLPTTFIAPNPSGSPSDRNVRNFRPTVWLQGCNESTHGISDSLLSVLSVRSGEIFNGIHEEGWFGKPSVAAGNHLHLS